MCCTTLTALEATVATTQLIRRGFGSVCWPQKDEPNVQSECPRMNWVVVTEESGNRRLHMDWRADRAK